MEQEAIVKDKEDNAKELAQEQSSDDSDSEESTGGRRRIGDKLFTDSGKGKSLLSAETVREYAKDMDPQMLEQLIEKQMPELNPMLFELRQATDELNSRIKPAMQILKAESRKFPKNCEKFLSMKHKLLLSYCSYIAFYLLMKLEGHPTDNHPVVFKLAHIKTLFDKLKPIEDKLQKAISVVLMKSDDESVHSSD